MVLHNYNVISKCQEMNAGARLVRAKPPTELKGLISVYGNFGRVF